MANITNMPPPISEPIKTWVFFSDGATDRIKKGKAKKLATSTNVTNTGVCFITYEKYKFNKATATGINKINWFITMNCGGHCKKGENPLS